MRAACTSRPFAGRFVLARRDQQWQLIDFPWTIGIAAAPVTGGFELSMTVRDRQAAGFSSWGRERIEDVQEPLRLEAHCQDVPSPDGVPWLEPFPNGAPAALCITDHPDFESVDKARLLADLMLREGLSYTKGVFPVGEPAGVKNEPGLDSPDYLECVRLLHAGGTEIAFHGIGPREAAPPLDECRRRADRLREFVPSTWIDHGRGAYLLSRTGRLQDGTRLVDFLDEYGVVNYWSYYDHWNNPAFALSSTAGRSACPQRSTMHGGWHAGGTVGVPSSARSIRLHILLKNLFGTEYVHQMVSSRRRALARLGGLARAFAENAYRRQHPIVCYGFDGTMFPFNLGRRWMFDTVLLNHPAAQLSPANVDRLIEAESLCLAHTYLACELPYVAAGAYTRASGAVQLSPEFRRNLSYLAARQREGQIAVVSFSALRASLTRHARSRVAWSRTRLVDTRAG